MDHKTAVWVGTAVAAPCRTSIGLTVPVAPGRAEVEIEAEKPDLGMAGQDFCAASCHSVKAHQSSPIVSSSFS